MIVPIGEAKDRLIERLKELQLKPCTFCQKNAAEFACTDCDTRWCKDCKGESRFICWSCPAREGGI